ncbi:MAG: sigma-54-dependent Fis family transcriptional regulator [Myxococcales bacterium]|nr:sigma-54-dependent Fis family transcriptional regulator [Myxococcales bacterium]
MVPEPSVLVVDDDESIREFCSRVLAGTGVCVVTCGSGAQAIELLARGGFDLAILDIRLPDWRGTDVLEWMRAGAPCTSVIVSTAYASLDLVVEAMRKGAVDFLVKPVSPEALRDAVHRALGRRSMPAAVSTSAPAPPPAPAADGLGQLVGRSAAMTQVHDLLRRVGPTDSTVLITGESGTGKEVVARTIRSLSPRRDKPFVVVDCGALVGTLFESELFGHVRGSFTGATSTKHGRLELADGGTVFLDEIANVTPDIQAKLLRVIQEREFTRVGSNQVVPVDVRILAATSRNLMEEIRAGRFREDLYYRLCVVPIVLPPLRQRADDIPLLAEHFLARYAPPGRRMSFSPAALQVLLRHSWPGNVRELQNTVERAVVLARGDVIEPRDLAWLAPDETTDRPAPRRLEDVEREHIDRVLRECGGNRSAAARVLGIHRKTLWRKLRG